MNHCQRLFSLFEPLFATTTEARKKMPRRYGRRPRRKKKLKMSLAQARSKRVDNLSEKIIATIAERKAKEVMKENRLTLVHRKYCFPASFSLQGVSFVYDKVNHEFGPGIPVSFIGEKVSICQIMKRDNVSMPVNLGNLPADDPYTETDEKQAAADQGNNQVAPIESNHGTRYNDTVTLTGLSLSVRARINRHLHQEVEEAEPIFLDNTELRYAVVLQTFDTPNTNTAQDAEIPTLLPWKPWGYTRLLDTTNQQQMEIGGRCKTLIAGKMFLNKREVASNVKQHDRYYKFKKPLKFQYPLQDKWGERTLKHKLWFVTRSNIPEVTNEDYDGFTPYVQACTKVFYYDQ